MALPYVKDCHIDTSKAVLYNKDKNNVQSQPEIYTKQIVANQMNTSSNLVGVA